MNPQLGAMVQPVRGLAIPQVLMPRAVLVAVDQVVTHARQNIPRGGSSQDSVNARLGAGGQLGVGDGKKGHKLGSAGNSTADVGY